MASISGGRTTAPIDERDELRFRAAGDGLVEQIVAERDVTVLDPKDWGQWRKVSLTRAARIPRRFIVETSEGELACDDGYLAVDARGYPYPIAADEFALIYERADVWPAPATGVSARIEELIRDLSALREKNPAETGVDPRNLSLAITALEDAQMRYDRADPVY